MHILDAIVRDDFAAATTDFDEPMRQTLTPSWAGYLEQFGTYQRHEVLTNVTGPKSCRRLVEPCPAAVQGELCCPGIYPSGNWSTHMPGSSAGWSHRNARERS